jgi:hypothetical protein
MPRNTAGTYSAPIYPFQTGTTIRSDDVNAYFGDLGSEITTSLSRNGYGAMLAQFKAHPGTAPAPGISFSSDLASGVYLAAASDVRMAVASTDVMKWTVSALTVYPNATFSGTLAVTGNTTLSGTLAVTGASTLTGNVSTSGTVTASGTGASSVGGALSVAGALSTSGGGETFSMKPGPSDRAFMGFYPRTSDPNTRGGILGFNTAASDDIYLVNERSGGSIGIVPGSGGRVITEGWIRFDNPSSPASTTPLKNTITPTNVTKAWGVFSTNGIGGVSTVSGFNVASSAITAGNLVITWAQAFADSNYAVSIASDAGGVHFRVSAQSTTSITIDCFEFSAPTTPGGYVDTSLATGARRIHVMCVGEQ